MEYMHIDAKTVEFEDGRQVDVMPFDVSRTCVTVGEFSRFTEATGHATIAEGEGWESYYQNILTSHTSAIERFDSTAYCMSYVDATAFCSWAGVRLVTEAEWLAASIVDERIYDWFAGERPPYCDERNVLVSSAMPPHLALHGNEITATTEGDRVVLRSGPKYYRKSTWRNDVRSNRKLRQQDYTDCVVCFRVCKDA